MKPDLLSPACPYCKTAAVLTEHITRYRRAEQVLSVDTWTWECSCGCVDPNTGAAPFRFVDAELMRWTDERAAALWQERFGVPMPPSRRGHRPGQRRTVRVPVMLTPAEADRLDRLRGKKPRGEFLREALQKEGRKAG